MDPVTAMALYGGGAGLSALGSFLGGKSQADALREANDKNERLTRESWQRDDTAVQRRTQDLVAAGLNPALAAGSAASTSSPLPMQAATDTGLASALQSAGQSASGAPTVEQMLKRSAAQTLQSESQANLTHWQAKIAEKDYQDIQAGNDPRDKTPINQIIKLLPRLVRNLQPGGAIREAGVAGYEAIDKAAGKLAAPAVNYWKGEGKKADDINRQLMNAIRRGDRNEARRLSNKLGQIREGGSK